MTQAYAQLLDNVRSVRRSWAARRLIEGLTLTIAAVVLLIAGATAADMAGSFGRVMRAVLALVIWGGAALAVWRWVVIPLTVRHSDDFFAALAESRQPGLGNHFINALQLGREYGERAPRLVEAVIAQGVAAAGRIDLAAAVRSDALKRRAAGLIGALAIVAALLLLGGPLAQTALARVLEPWAVIDPFTWTHLTISADHPDGLLQGSPLSVTVQASGRQPSLAQINWIGGDGQRRAAPMKSAGSDGFSYRFPAVDAAMTIFATGGDGRSRSLAVTIEPRPRIEAVDITYLYPPYAGLKDHADAKSDGRFHALAGTHAIITFHANKPLSQFTLAADDKTPIAVTPADADCKTWTGRLTITRSGALTGELADRLGNQAPDTNLYTVAVEQDAPPIVGFALPGKNLQVRPAEKVTFKIVAQDDFGLGSVRLMGQADSAKQPRVLQAWPNDETQPRKRVEMTLVKTPAELGLHPGSHLQYWAEAQDRNNVTGPGRGQTIRYTLDVLTPGQAGMMLDRQLADYAARVTELLRLQRANRTETAGYLPAAPLIDRQGIIRGQTQALADLMAANSFPAQTITDELRRLAAEPMAQAIAALERYRDTPDLSAAKPFADAGLVPQDKIIDSLQNILERLNRDQAMRKDLKDIKRADPTGHDKITAELDKLGKDLDKFLQEQKQLDQNAEKMPKKPGDDLKAQALGDNDPEHRMDRWKKWSKDSIDALMKLPDGFAKDSHLAETVSTIFEEIEKKDRLPTKEIATPAEEGAKMLGTKTLEDLEVWMPDRGDNVKWVMEDPPEGAFKVPEMTLPDTLQDMIGDLIEDAKDFDEQADDVTSSWGGNLPQAGWDIADGPISSFSATGKTGNQLPNDSEITGRSGAGRRGKATGQMVGDTSSALEGRPTPARLTNEKYEAGEVKADKQLDPRGATGGGKVTGGGQRGLQGGTPPPALAKEMERLQKNQQEIREKTQTLANKLDVLGRSSSRVNRALDLFKAAENDLHDYRYQDAARKRKLAVGELRAEQSQIDEALSMTLDKARDLPASMRKEIAAGAQQALPEGYEDMVGAYYKALSTAGNAQPPSPPQKP